MQRRQITLEDGRYLIFYTFDEKPTAAAAPKENAGEEKSSAPDVEEPDAEPQATEERRV